MKFGPTEMTLWAWAGMQPHFLAQFTQALTHHTPTRGHSPLKTQEVYYLYNRRLCWLVKVRYGEGRKLTFWHPLVLNSKGNADLVNHCVVLFNSFCIEMCLLQRLHTMEKITQFGALVGQIQCASA